MKLPLTVDVTPWGEIIDQGDMDLMGRAENVEYILQLLPVNDGVTIAYYGDDDTFLDADQVNFIVQNALSKTK